MLVTKDKSFYKQFFSLYWVLVLHNIIILGVNLADNIMIGSYSETALSGVGAINQIQFIFQQIVMSAGSGLVALGSQYWGQERTKEIKKLSSCAMLVGVVTSAVLFTVAAAFPEKVVGIFSPSQDIISEGAKYLAVIKYTYPVFAVTNILLASLRSVETVKIGFYISLVTLVTNCSINYLLIFGNFGAPEMGVEGAATGTLVARVLELVIVVFYVLTVDKKLRLGLRNFFEFDKSLFKDYAKTAFPIILVGGMFGVSTALQSVILGHMSDNAIAANSMSTTLYQTLKVASVGASNATAVIIGKTIGIGNMQKLKEYVKTLQLMFVGIGVVISVTMFLVRTPILSLYNLSPETYSLANAFILVLCVTGFGMSYQMPTIIGIVQGGGDGKFVIKNDFISIWCIVLPLSFLAAFVFKWSPVAVVFCLNLDQLFKCIPGFIKVNRYTWVKKLTND
ncbi:MAG: MATE family efflux transporter [Clostridia bacterium]|nr:MATE family efflux transporter [Clostridia bacterium]